ncbi:putative lipid-transfer protein DIR1 [Nymphaea colorata]|uniref:Bifunctional inhibitor/plant lipid transfer protein/seed storage helical domain-containing protein n=1 Tax=Nymphaea colorata TaxID=210225 RepID=A0A5K1A2V1_9MAGN|nr:putative lipid-transfer protein DIR1 [Nymphaea colorata]
MEAKLKLPTTVVLLVAMTLGAAAGFGMGPLQTQPSALCNMSQDGLMACKPWVTTGSAALPIDPSAPCCAALAGADLTCLCSYRNSMVLPALGIDPKLAMLLPKKCNILPPPQC